MVLALLHPSLVWSVLALVVVNVFGFIFSSCVLRCICVCVFAFVSFAWHLYYGVAWHGVHDYRRNVETNIQGFGMVKHKSLFLPSYFSIVDDNLPSTLRAALWSTNSPTWLRQRFGCCKKISRDRKRHWSTSVPCRYQGEIHNQFCISSLLVVCITHSTFSLFLPDPPPLFPFFYRLEP
jgi:hypothetical protein